MNIATPSHQTTLKSDAATIPAVWWHGAMIYQVYPRSFLDTNGDGIGDLPGVLERLEYIASLGVDGVWLSPFFTSPMLDFGYDVADYCSVDPIFGTLADFDAIVEKAHGLGLKIIIDQVYSHTSSHHAWFAESRQDKTNPKADWYVWADPKPDGAPPTNWQSVFGGPSWEWDSRRQQYYLHNFLREQPDLNLHNPEAQEAVLDAARFWLDRGVDGFRLDALNFAMHDPEFRDNPPADTTGILLTRPFDYQQHTYNQSHADIPGFLERLRGVMDDYGAIFTVAEVGGPDPLAEMKAFTKGNRRLNSAYDFSFLYAETLNNETVMEAQKEWSDGSSWASWAFSNHDAPRAVTRWAPREKRAQAAKLYLMLLMSLRGNPILYQGEELGLPQAYVPFEKLQDPEAIANWPLTLGRDGARTPLPWTGETPHAGFTTCDDPWLAVDSSHIPLSIAAQDADPASTLTFTRRLIALRRDEPVLRLGTLRFECSAEGPLVFRRRWQDQDLIAVFNLTGALQSLAELGSGTDTWPPLITVGPEPDCDTAKLPGTLEPFSGFLAKRTSG